MDYAKAASTFVGVNISFHFNRLWTFQSKAKYFDDLKRYLALYSLTIAVNVYANKVSYMILEDINTAYLIALFISVTITSFRSIVPKTTSFINFLNLCLGIIMF